MRFKSRYINKYTLLIVFVDCPPYNIYVRMYMFIHLHTNKYIHPYKQSIKSLTMLGAHTHLVEIFATYWRSLLHLRRKGFIWNCISNEVIITTVIAKDAMDCCLKSIKFRYVLYIWTILFIAEYEDDCLYNMQPSLSRPFTSTFTGTANQDMTFW